MKYRIPIHFYLHEFIHYAASTVILSFSTTYLLGKGFPADQVGALLAGAGFLSCLTQPFLAARADRAGKNILPLLIALLAAASFLSFAAVLFLPLPGWAFCGLYLLGYWSFDLMVPLLNATSVYYNARGIFINYGLARSLGSLAHALTSLTIGYVIALLGLDWMIAVILALLVLHILLSFTYPRTEASAPESTETAPNCCSIGTFLLRYRWYCLSLLGILLLGMFLAMIESYMISIMERLGGDSSHVGIAFFIATVGAAPVFACVSRLRRKLSDNVLLMTAALSFLARAVLLLAAPSIPFVYAQQLLQMTSYAILAPVQVCYAMAKVAPEDMVKGQAFITAAYTLGCGFGNMAGGFLVEHHGVAALLYAGVAFTAAGTLVLALTVGKTDQYISSKL